jgi:hypothetical protein
MSGLVTTLTATFPTRISPESKPDFPSDKLANSRLITWHEPELMRVAYNILM